MGKVFNREEMEKNMIPSGKDFEEAIKFVKKTILESETIIGGLVFGSMASVIDGSYNCRSDFDLLILHNTDKSYGRITEEFHVVFNFFQEHNIPLDLIIVSDKFATTDVHQIKPILAPHLFWCAREFGFVKYNPLDFIQFKCDPAKDFKNYVKHKMRLESQLPKMDFMDETELCRFLQKILEAPFHIARNFINCCGKGVESHGRSRGEIVSLYSEVVNIQGRSMLTRCMLTNDLYSEYLNKGNCATYFDILSELKSYAWESIEFIKLNAQLANSYFNK